MVCGIAAAADTPIPLPKSTPLPMTTPTDRGPYFYFPAAMFLAANRTLVPMDLGKAGYTEEEFMISGKANVYDWADDGTLSVKTPGAPYATRILVRRPADPARFSGTVVVELMISARRFDWPMMWGFLKQSILDRSDAWVGITMPGGVPGLLKYNHARYSDASFKNPAPGACATANAATEEGLRWDMLSQVGAALKIGAPSQPLAGFKVQYLYMTSQLGDIVTYINAIHPRAKLANGNPVYDGYLVKALGAQGGPGRINQCAAAPAKSNSRYIVRNVGVPVMGVSPQSEVIESLAARRPDSDKAGDLFRVYEIAGAQHLTKTSYDGMASLIDQDLAGVAQGTPEWPFNVRCTPEIQLNESPLLDYMLHSSLSNLDQWVRKGTTPPRAPRISVKDADGPQPTVALDQYGNAMGGVRTFFVDYPAATYYMASIGPGVCTEFGHTAPFDWGRLETLYGSYKNFANKVSQSVDRSVKERWITPTDARKIKAELKVSAEPAVTK